MKKANGITLIALVITIIVLIILAGVSINLVLGENGIIAKAKEAKEKSEQAKLNEDVSLNELVEEYEDIMSPSIYTITFNGINVTSNGTDTINRKSTYKATLTPTVGYEITSIIITMGEKTLIENEDYIYNNGTIEIPKVIENIEINVEAKEYSIALNKSSINLKIEKDGTNITKDTEILTATILSNMDRSVTWKSNNESVATVSNGKVTPVASGTAIITATINDESNKSASCSVTVETTTTGKSILKTGDYVRYEPTSQTYTMTTTQTGYSSSQTFNTADATKLWQVLYNNDTYGIQITSSESVASLGLGTKKNQTNSSNAYNNGIVTLNTMCANYVNKKYAVSARSIGSNPSNPNSGSTTKANVSSIRDGASNKLYNRDTNYTTDVEAMASATSQNSSGITIIGSDYFLASRYVYKTSDHYSFYINYINNSTGKTLSGDGNTTYRINACSDGAGWSSSWAGTATKGVRPVVKLADGIKVTTGKGTINNPYILKPIS